MTFSQRVFNKWVLGVLVAAVAVIAVLPMLGEEAEAGSNVPYYDESGTLQNAPTTIDLTGGATTLTAGNWYSLSASITLGAVTFVGTGEVCIIIPSGFTMGASGTITVASGIHLKLYTDTLDHGLRGVMSSAAAGTTIQIFTLANGATLTNMVNVRYAGTSSAASAVYNSAGNSGTVYNYGELFGSTNTGTNGGFGVRFLGSGTIINHPTGVIKSGGGIYRDTFTSTDVLTNYGEITAVTTNGVLIANGMGYLITNNGTIAGAVGNHGIHLSSTALGSSGKIVNSGRIAGGPTLVTNAAIYANNSATIVNNLGGTLTGSNGIYIGNFNNGVTGTKDYIENYGTVQGNGTGGSEATIRGRAIYVAAGADFVVTNQPGAEINGYLRGIQFSNTALTGKIYNYGLIYGGTVITSTAPSYGIHFGISTNYTTPGNGTGTIINYPGGRIIGTTGVYIANFNAATCTLTNSGLIEGTGTTGTSTDVIGKGIIILDGNGTLFTNESTGEVKGIQSGIYFTTPGTAGASCKIDNKGKITSNNGPAVYVVKSGTVINTGDGINNGIIQSAGGSGIHIAISSGPGGSGDFITNSGRIQGTSGIFIQAGVSTQITNNATGKIIATGNGVTVSGTMSGTTKGSITNYGRIEGGTAGSGINTTIINVYNAAGDGINTGIITGGTGLYYKMSNTAGYSTVNDGMIVGTTGPGVYFYNNTVPNTVTTVPAVVTNNNTGKIIGATHGIFLSPYTAGPPIDQGIARGVIDNYGTISAGTTGVNCGIYGGISLSLTNRAGAEITGAYGIRVNNFNGAADSIINSGLISGTDRGVYFAGGSSILLTNNNEIEGGTVGVRMDASGKVVNDGSIEGTSDTGIHLAAGGEVANNGTITGAIYGINASAGANPVTLTNADIINGNVVLNAGTVTVTFTFSSRINGDFDISSCALGSKLSFTDPASALGTGLIYSTVTGTSNIGAATVDVDFDTLPASYIGTDIVLIDGRLGSVSGSSANSTYALAPHTFFIRVKMGDQLVASLSQNDILVTLESDPAGPDIYFTIITALSVSLTETQYTSPFFMGSSETLTLKTFDITGYEFVEWADDDGNSLSTTLITTPLDLTPYLGDCDVTFTARFLQMVLVTMGSNLAGADLYYTITTSGGITLAETPYAAPFFVSSNDKIALRVGDMSGYDFVKWVDDDANLISNTPTTAPFVLTAYLGDHEVTFTALFSKTPVPGTEYRITAIADSGSTITPSGVVIVKAGGSQTFTFAAKEGYTIVEVWIDGHIALSHAQIDLGTYTFTNVMADHTIQVKSVAGQKRDLTLTIEIKKGEGYAEYNLNGAGFVRYTGVVTFTAGSSIAARAVAGDGYVFDRWETPDVVNVSSISFNDVRASKYLELYFAVDDTGDVDNANLILLITVLLLLAVLFLILFFLLWYRSGLYLTVMMGEAVAGASVTYRIERDGKVTNGIKETNSKGKLRIVAKKDSVVTITMAAKDGHIAIGLPLIVTMENRKEFREIILK